METIIILDCGGQYCHLISRRLRQLGVNAIIKDAAAPVANIKATNPKGIIISGGAASVAEQNAPSIDPDVLTMNIPVLGICYGHQLIANYNKATIETGKTGEYGLTTLSVFQKGKLLEGFNNHEQVWMNHRDVVKEVPSAFIITAVTTHTPVAAFQHKTRPLYGVQFHPEVTHTEKGTVVLENFLFSICGINKSKMESSLLEEIKQEAKKTLEEKKVIIGLSGGIDSSTAAVLIHQVIHNNLIAVYVDTGLMRHKETDFVKNVFIPFNLNLRIINAEDRFLEALKNIVDPEEKRKIIGKLFIDIFREVAEQEHAEVLVQGTIYSDRIESGSTKHSSNIKSHHNVGGLPEQLGIELYEPLRNLYKDEVRSLAKQLGLTDELLKRQVFPGPGLAIRIIGEVTKEKANIVRHASHIIEEELKKTDWYDQIWMSFAVLLSIKSVGVQGDARTYKYPVVIRIIQSTDAMTANVPAIEHEILTKIANRITNEIVQVNRVLFDLSSKPPATMEWE